jgi:hypothetical protein
MADQTETPHDPPGIPGEDESQQGGRDPHPADPEPEGVQPRPGEGTAGDDLVR